MLIFSLRNPAVAFVLFSIFAGVQAQSAHAAPTASGRAYDISIHLSIVGVPFDVNPLGDIQFANEPAAWSDSQQTAALNAAAVGAQVSAQDLDVEAQWRPSDSFLIVGTQATVNNLSLGTVDGLGSALLSLAATQIQATSLIGGTCPATARPALAKSLGATVGDYIYFDGFDERTLVPKSDTSTPGLSVAMQGTSLLGLPLNPMPNTTLMLPAGSGVLVLDEQTVTGDGVTGLTLSNNGIHLTLNVLGLVAGDVIVAHADAGIACN